MDAKFSSSKSRLTGSFKISFLGTLAKFIHYVVIINQQHRSTTLSYRPKKPETTTNSCYSNLPGERLKGLFSEAGIRLRKRETYFVATMRP